MTESKANKQISFRPNDRTIERLDRMTKIRRPMDTWVNGRADLTASRGDLINEYCIDGLRRDESFLKYMEKEQEKDDQSWREIIQAPEEKTEKIEE